MIRQATEADIPRMVDLGKLFHAYSGLTEVSFDPESFRITLANGLHSPDQAYFVIDSDGVQGMIGGIKYPSYFNHKQICCQELFWWVLPGFRGDGVRLYRHLEEWAKQHDCASVTMIMLDDENGERMDKLYRRMGYRPTEHCYMKGI